MIFTGPNATGAEQVFVVGKNITGVTTALSAGVPVAWDCVTVTDGHAFSATKSSSPVPGLFAGVTDRSSINGDDGVLLQVYGFRTSAYVSQASAAIAAGSYLYGIGGVFQSAYSATIALGHNFITLMDTTSAKSAGTIEQFGIFIRAM